MGQVARVAIGILDEQPELGAEAAEQAERHDVHERHDPSVGVGEDVDLPTEVRLYWNVFEHSECQNRGQDDPRDEDDGDIVHPQGAPGGVLRGDPREAEEPEAHEPWAEQLNDGHPQVADASLYSQGGALLAFREEVAR